MNQFLRLASLLEEAATALRLADSMLEKLPSEPADQSFIDFARTLSVRARKILIHQDIRSLAQLTAMSVSDLQQFRNCGPTTLREIRNGLVKSGLDLRDGSLHYGVPEVTVPVQKG
jgi:DNA-directed RNA polymerase alpha subunit